MKLLLTGDWHIDTNKPERRIDDYWQTVQKKIAFILRLAKKHNCELILQPGDFFNSHKANDFLKRYMIKELTRVGVKVVTIFGQHDLRYHSSDTLNTPLAVLNSAGVLHVAFSDPIDFGHTHIYGASWYENIPKPLAKNVLNILICHKMIIKNEKVWEGQEDATMGNILLKKSGMDLIVSGDNHLHFTITTKSGKHLVNCGSLLRTNIDQVDHTPLVYTYNTEDRTITPHEVPHKPFSKVFDMSAYTDEKERDEELEAFVNRLAGEVGLGGLDFIKNMDSYTEENKKEIDAATMGIIGEVMA